MAALVRQLEGLARQQSVLLVFEDAQWADQTSLELLERTAERVPNLPVLMVITFRPEFEPPWTGQAQVTSLTLSRLGQRDTASLVERLAEGKMLPSEITERIVERTDGIPLFIEELTKTVLEGGLLQEEDNRYILTGSLPSLAIPASLHDSLLARLDRLAPVKEVAQIGAAIGREFSYDLLAAVAHRPERQMRDALDQLVDTGLIFRRGVLPDASFIFKHALVQDAAYGTLLRGRRRELHVSIATALEKRFADAPSEHAALLSYHWLRAEDWERALKYTLEAAGKAASLFARPEAISHYWQALELLEHLPRTPERSRVHRDIAISLIQLPASMPDEAARRRMLRHFDQALTNAAQAGDMAAGARLQALKGRYWDDESLLIDAVARAEKSGDILTEAFVTRDYGQWLGLHARFEKALYYLDRAVEILGAEGRQREQAGVMASGARCYSARAGRLAEASLFASRAWAAADVVGDPGLYAYCGMEAEVRYYRGHWNELIAIVEKALPVAWEIRQWEVVLWLSAWLTIGLIKLRQLSEAGRVIDRALKETPGRVLAINNFAVISAQIALAQFCLVTGDAARALNAARQALVLSRQLSVPLEEGAAQRTIGQAHEAMGDRAEAEAAFNRSVEILEEIESLPELAQTLLAYGRFRRGDNALEDRAMIERALALFEEMGATGWAEEARAALDA